MGGMISFMNTFFVASILICCLLVLMLIYNFRQRLNTVESNYKLTLDMLNNVVQKMNMIENENMSSGGYVSQQMNIPYVDISEQQSTGLIQRGNEDSDNEYDEESDEESDNDAESDEESDNDGDDEESDNDGDDEESDNDGDDEESDNDGDDEEQHKDGDDEEQHKDGDDEEQHKDGDDEEQHKDGDDGDDDDDATISTEDGNEIAERIESEGELDYDKMTLKQLRSLVKSRGLSTSVSKMKKGDALALLTM
jgi:hypothetical protein